MASLKILAAIALICSVAWVIKDPGFESALAVIGALTGLIAALFLQKRTERSAQQHQSVSKSSIGVQVGGNVNIRICGGDKRAE